MKKLLQVHIRGGFSDRNKINTENTEIQLIDFDERTRNAFNSAISLINNQMCTDQFISISVYKQQFYCFVLSEIYAQRVDYSKQYYFENITADITETIGCDTYDSVLSVIEALAQYWNRYYKNETKAKLGMNVFEFFNGIFKKEYVGYRFIGNIIVPISDEKEVSEIQSAITESDDAVATHFEKATGFLSDREKPDYENSIKESITAVEAMCEVITGNKGNNATLGFMLKTLEEKGIKIHSALKSAFEKLYGYTSDANGIRHAGDIGGPDSTFEEAKFMLVSCCAFVNYLRALQAKTS